MSALTSRLSRAFLASGSEAAVDCGVLPTGPLGPPPCLQTGAIGGPADPCSYIAHRLTPEEVTIGKGGQVLSSNYKDQWKAYDAGTSFPMRFRNIEAKHVLTVTPARP